MPGFVIVTYNSADVIDACLEACLRVPDADVIVVDNASTDGTVDRVRAWNGVRCIANVTNRGFGAAVNQGFSACDQRAILVLNPDAVPLRGVGILEQETLSPGVGAATGQLLGADGAPQAGFNIRLLPTAATLAFEALGLNRLWPGNPVNRKYRVPLPTARADVEQPAGAFLMIRRSAWEQIGGFDEGFFPIWFEDVDFCKRLLDKGLRVRYVPEAAARHQGGHSAAGLSWRDRQLFWYGSLLRYASKHLRVSSRRAVGLAVILACFPRTLAAMPRHGIRQPVSVYSRVVWRAGQCLRKGERGYEFPSSGQPAKEQFKQSQ